MALNDPRTIPFDFRVFEAFGIAWLYDDSDNSYICSQVKQCYCEPLYHIEHEDDEEYAELPQLPEPAYFTRADVERRERHTIGIDAELDADDVEAWDEARRKPTRIVEYRSQAARKDHIVI